MTPIEVPGWESRPYQRDEVTATIYRPVGVEGNSLDVWFFDSGLVEIGSYDFRTKDEALALAELLQQVLAPVESSRAAPSLAQRWSARIRGAGTPRLRRCGMTRPLEQIEMELLEVRERAKRHGEAQDIADAVAFLIQSDFITGNVIYVDGGRHLHEYSDGPHPH